MFSCGLSTSLNEKYQWWPRCLQRLSVRGDYCMQPEKVRLVRQWIIKANRDLLAVSHLMDGNPPLLNAAVYHCQQAAEKALKGYLTWHDRPFQRTHNLSELVQLSSDVDKSLLEL